MLENPMVTGLSQALARHYSTAADDTFGRLRDDMRDALLQGKPTAMLSTPGFSRPLTSAADVINDNFAGASGEASLNELLAIVGEAAKAGNERALAWIDARAEEYAAFHLDDVLEASV